MFEFLLVTALIVAVVAAFLFLRPNKSDLLIIETELESLNKSVYPQGEENEFSCLIKHEIGAQDQLVVYPNNQAEGSSSSLGIIPYEFKGRILHFINTKNLDCTSKFNKTTEELTIDLIDD